MTEEFMAFLKELQNADDIEEVVDEIIEWMQDKDISGNIKYNIEIELYNLMEHTKTVKSFLRQAKPFIRKALDTETIRWNWDPEDDDYEAVTGYDDE